MLSISDFLADPGSQNKHDIVCFAYSFLFQQGGTYVRDRPTWCCVHDPMEIFPECPDWSTMEPIAGAIELVRRADAVIVISQEMQSHLERYGLHVLVLPTTSHLSYRSEEDLCRSRNSNLRVLTVGRVYPRKNYELFLDVRGDVSRQSRNKVEFHAKLNYRPLPEVEYIELLDHCDVYICTSYQEGGPLPAMDAMCRGELVLTTCVGQMPEIVRNGVTGFICQTRQEFSERLCSLAEHPEMVYQLRRNSLKHIQDIRNRDLIVKSVARALDATCR